MSKVFAWKNDFGLWTLDFGLPSSLLFYPLFFRVWCNASIRVLETRGDSSILSSRTKKTVGRRRNQQAGNKVLLKLNWMGATLRTSRLWVRIPPGAPTISDFRS